MSVLPLVAILGRPNVGKSTLFNRIVGGRPAIVDDLPGVTRDRLEAAAEWAGRHFRLIDTGGIDEGSAEAPLIDRVREQSLRAAEVADVIVFVTDARAGTNPVDAELARRVVRFGRPVLLAANKVDGPKQEPLVPALYEVGLGDPIGVSAEHGRGIDELLDALIAVLPEAGETETPESHLRLALIGRPNVGKSSLLNRLLGEERMVVDDRAGTTRDSVDSTIETEGEPIVLVDTAGIRRRSRVEHGVERASVARALRAAERADAALLVFDVLEGLTDQDARLARLVSERGRALLLIGNKWDRLDPGSRKVKSELERIQESYAHLARVPALFVSALAGTGVDRILPEAVSLARRFRTRLPTHELNERIAEWTRASAPPIVRGKRARIFYAASVGSAPPTVVLFVNDPARVTTTYLRYLENRIREQWPLAGVPLRLKLRERRGSSTRRGRATRASPKRGARGA